MFLLVIWNSLLFTVIAYTSPHNTILTVCRWVFHCVCNRSNSSCCSFFSSSNRSSSSSRSWFCLVIRSNSSSSCAMVWFYSLFRILANELELQTTPLILLLQIVHVSLSIGTKHLARSVITFRREFVSDRARVFVAVGVEALVSKDSIAALLVWRLTYSAESSLSSCLHCFVWCSISQFTIHYQHRHSYCIQLNWVAADSVPRLPELV